MSKKPMRDLMPESAAIVDAFRDAGLVDGSVLAAGMKAGTFWFSEAGHSVGKPGAREACEAESAHNKVEQEKADAAWAQECATYPRLMHCYRPDAFAKMQADADKGKA